MTASTDSLSRAIAYLGAVEVAPGRYAVKVEGDSVGEADCWYITNADGLCAWAASGASMDAEPLVEMPAWWTPERQTKERTVYEVRYFDGAFPHEYDGCCGHQHDCAAAAMACYQNDKRFHTGLWPRVEPVTIRTSVNLETGEEISA